MRQSNVFIPTLKDVTSEAQIPSHQLMLRAGLVRSVAAGVYSFLPLGYRILKKAMEVVREEMDNIGGQEFHLPGLSPSEVWEKTGRRNLPNFIFGVAERELVLAPTHEEIVTLHAHQHVKSYKDMPQIWYQIQTKFRNEPRPRSGVLRGRQFTMKDSYSLDSTQEGLDIAYEKHNGAYHRIFERCGLKFFSVGASSGAMGGSMSQEFMVESEHGEDSCVVCDETGYAANIEVAESAVPAVERMEESPTLEEFATPNAKTINELIEQFNLPEERCFKSVVYIADSKPVLALMSGNDELNESKLQKALQATEVRPAEPEELITITGASAGSIGPVQLKDSDCLIIADNRLHDANQGTAGANKDGFHFKNIDLQRDCTISGYHDLRVVRDGELDVTGKHKLRVVNAIEIGHIFKLGTKYSQALQALFLDKNGKTQPIIMGSYGIGVERIIACFIEQNHDENGIIWSPKLTPFHIHLLGVNIHKSEAVKEACEELYKAATDMGLEVLFDDRKVSPGIKFNDADLLGFPVQLVVGEKNLRGGNVEIKFRHSGERDLIIKDEALQTIQKFLAGDQA
jgi:prolyl-tRNA synthetase